MSSNKNNFDASARCTKPWLMAITSNWWLVNLMLMLSYTHWPHWFFMAFSIFPLEKVSFRCIPHSLWNIRFKHNLICMIDGILASFDWGLEPVKHECKHTYSTTFWLNEMWFTLHTQYYVLATTTTWAWAWEQESVYIIYTIQFV